jgi:cytochrome c biogenesis protein CcmG, thiol:disulfide interchange protein DsbE
MRLHKPSLVLALVIALAGCGDEPVARQNEPAPELAALDGHEQVVRIADLRGKVVLVNFWLAGCGPCLAEMPGLDAVYRRHKDKGLEILGVNFGQSQIEIDDAARRTGVTFPLLRDPLKIAMRRYAVVGTPTSFLIDAQGVIRRRIDGPLSGQALEQQLAEML